MSATETYFETAVDSSNDEETREQAIDDLEAANECDMLADLVRNDELDDTFRERALTGLAHPQCEATLESLADSGDVSETYSERASRLLEETPDDAGAGP